MLKRSWSSSAKEETANQELWMRVEKVNLGLKEKYENVIFSDIPCLLSVQLTRGEIFGIVFILKQHRFLTHKHRQPRSQGQACIYCSSGAPITNKSLCITTIIPFPSKFPLTHSQTSLVKQTQALSHLRHVPSTLVLLMQGVLRQFMSFSHEKCSSAVIIFTSIFILVPFSAPWKTPYM